MLPSLRAFTYLLSGHFPPFLSLQFSHLQWVCEIVWTQESENMNGFLPPPPCFSIEVILNFPFLLHIEKLGRFHNYLTKFCYQKFYPV